MLRLSGMFTRTVAEGMKFAKFPRAACFRNTMFPCAFDASALILHNDLAPLQQRVYGTSECANQAPLGTCSNMYSKAAVLRLDLPRRLSKAIHN